MTEIDHILDVQGRRIGKKVNGELKQAFVYESDLGIAAELDGRGQVVKQFIYGSKPNVPDYMITKEGKYRIYSDHLGSPRFIVDIATGKVKNEMNYDEFGNLIDCKYLGLVPFGFAGGLYDNDTGLVRFGVRDYDPMVGRWLSKDPIGFWGGQTNLYGYVMNDPINWIDPLGLSQEQIDDGLFWIKGNYPELTNGVNATVTDSMLGKTLSLGDEGFTAGNRIYIDTGSIITKPMNDADVVGMIAHELQHVKKGFLYTLFRQTSKEHEDIYGKQSDVRLGYRNGSPNMCNGR